MIIIDGMKIYNCWQCKHFKKRPKDYRCENPLLHYDDPAVSNCEIPKMCPILRQVGDSVPKDIDTIIHNYIWDNLTIDCNPDYHGGIEINILLKGEQISSESFSASDLDY